jgi:hypothetical protein
MARQFLKVSFSLSILWAGGLLVGCANTKEEAEEQPQKSIFDEVGEVIDEYSQLFNNKRAAYNFYGKISVDSEELPLNFERSESGELLRVSTDSLIRHNPVLWNDRNRDQTSSIRWELDQTLDAKLVVTFVHHPFSVCDGFYRLAELYVGTTFVQKNDMKYKTVTPNAYCRDNESFEFTVEAAVLGEALTQSQPVVVSFQKQEVYKRTSDCPNGCLYGLPRWDSRALNVYLPNVLIERMVKAFSD